MTQPNPYAYPPGVVPGAAAPQQPAYPPQPQYGYDAAGNVVALAPAPPGYPQPGAPAVPAYAQPPGAPVGPPAYAAAPPAPPGYAQPGVVPTGYAAAPPVSQHPQYAPQPQYPQTAPGQMAPTNAALAAQAAAIAGATLGFDRKPRLTSQNGQRAGFVRCRINFTETPERATSAWVAEFTVLETLGAYGGPLPGIEIGEVLGHFQALGGPDPETLKKQNKATKEFLIAVLGYKTTEQFLVAGKTGEELAAVAIALGTKPGPFVGRQFVACIKANKTPGGWNHVDFEPDRPLV